MSKCTNAASLVEAFKEEAQSLRLDVRHKGERRTMEAVEAPGLDRGSRLEKTVTARSHVHIDSRQSLAEPLTSSVIVARARELSGAWLADESSCASSPSIDARIVLPRFLLGLYALPPCDLVDEQVWRETLSNAAQRVRSGPLSSVEPLEAITLASTQFGELSASEAHRIHEQDHYLGTARDGRHLGLFHRGRALSLLTLSDLDVSFLRNQLPDHLSSAEVLVVSRIVVSKLAPPNTASFMLGRAFAWLRRHRPEVRLLLTYLDPNLGFSGALYRATNWSHFAVEPKSAYIYLDGTHITLRELRKRYGTYEWSALRHTLGSRLSTSLIKLEPLTVLGYSLDRK